MSPQLACLATLTLMLAHTTAWKGSGGLIGSTYNSTTSTDNTTAVDQAVLPAAPDTTNINPDYVPDDDWQPRYKSKGEAKAQSMVFKLALQGWDSRTSSGKMNKLAQRWWNSYKQTNLRSYLSSDEEEAAKLAWMNSLAEVTDNNLDDNQGWISGLNKYSDMSSADKQKKLLLQNNPIREKVVTSNPLNDPVLLTEEFLTRMPISGGAPSAASRKLQQTSPVQSWADWRGSCQFALRDQGACSSCWAFAASSAVECLHSWSTKTNKGWLAVQQLIDCEKSGRGGWSEGCNGGYSDAAIDYIYKFNLTTESRYPYTKSLGASCRATATTIPAGTAVQLGGTASVVYPTQNNPVALMNAVYITPVVAYLNASSAFQSYAGGLFNPTTAQCDPARVNHAVLVIGYQWTGRYTDSYFIIMNSWGGSWGEGGFAKIAMQPAGSPGVCGLQQYPMYLRRDDTSTREA